MKITNRYGFPESIVRAVENDPYKGGGDISVTRLISPAQQVALQKIHAGELVEDVSDRIWSLSGQAMHHVLERAHKPGDIVEARLSARVLDWNVTGQFDLLTREGVLTDFKQTSVWAVKDALANGKDEWEEQLNSLAYLVKKNLSKGFPEVNKLQILAICRDWRRNEAMRYDDYPMQAELIDIDLWDFQTQEEFINARVAEHQRAQSGVQINCTKKEMWTKPDTWAVMKKGRKTAIRVFDSHEEADDLMVNQDLPTPLHYIEHRPGSNVRCEQYCNVRDFCPQYQESKGD